jgi:hypothetical protein
MDVEKQMRAQSTHCSGIGPSAAVSSLDKNRDKVLGDDENNYEVLYLCSYRTLCYACDTSVQCILCVTPSKNQ